MCASWIRRESDRAARRAEIRGVFETDLIGVVAVEGLLDDEVVADIAAASEAADFTDEYRLIGATDPVARSAWLEAGDDERLWHVGRMRTLSQDDALSDGALGLLRLKRSAATLGGWLADVLGEPMGDGAGPVLTRLDAGHTIRPHVLDPVRVRCRVDIVISRWDQGWGGRYVAVGPAERTRRLSPARGCAFIVDATRTPTTFVAPRAAGAPPMMMLTMTFSPAEVGAP